MKIRPNYLWLAVLIFLLSNSISIAQKPCISASKGFIENQGQVVNQEYESRPDVLYYQNSNGLSSFFLNNGIDYCRYYTKSYKENTSPKIVLEDNKVPDSILIERLEVRWLEFNEDFQTETDCSSEESLNFFYPGKPDGVMNVKSFESLTYNNLYDGIDLKWYTIGNTLKYDFIVGSSGDYQDIKWSLNGAKSLRLDNEGNLIIEMNKGELVEEAPRVFQNGKEIPAFWTLNGNTIGFNIPDADNSKSMIIDPIIRVWSSYLGGTENDNGFSTTMDDNNIFLIGRSSSTNIATSGAYQQVMNGVDDVFLSKINLNGNVLWTTYLGGSDNDEGSDCVIGSNGIFIAGYTSSTDFVTSNGCHQDTLNAGQEAFLAKFGFNGNLLWSTYYGGESFDEAFSLSNDLDDNVYLVGTSRSDIGISTLGSHQQFRAGDNDAFIAKFNTNGKRLWGTYFGGSETENSNEGAIDKDFNLYFCGRTSSLNNIASMNAHKTTNDSIDAFLVKMDSSGKVLWSTYFGGENIERGYGLTLDYSSNVYLCGSTLSSLGISTSGAHQETFGGVEDGFISKFNTDGTLLWSTYVGGEDNDAVVDCTIGDFSSLFVTGTTQSISGISTLGGFQETHGGEYDAFLSRFSESGQISSSSYFGGVNNDFGYAVASNKGDIVFVGYTSSNESIASSGAHQEIKGGFDDAFFARFRENPLGLDLITDEGDFIIYPNPANDCINIISEIQMNSSTSFEIFNITGEKVYSGIISRNNNNILDVSKLENGIYLLKLNKQKIETHKFIVIH